MTSEPPERSCLILMAAVVVMVTAWFLASSIFAGGTDSIHSSIATFIVWGTGGRWGQKRGRDEIQAAAFFSVLTILCSATTQGFIPILHLNVSTNQWIFKP